MILLVSPISALEIRDLSVSQSGENLVFKVRLYEINDPKNTSVQLHYIFDSDVGNRRTWNYSFMEYDGSSDEWRTEIEKKGSTGTIYYYVTVLYHGEQYRYPENGTESYIYSPVIGVSPQMACLIAFFIIFIIFEVVMRYPVLKKRKSEEEEERSEKEEKKEDPGIAKCPNCGKIIPANSETCPYCNSPLKNGVESKEITMGDD